MSTNVNQYELLYSKEKNIHKKKYINIIIINNEQHLWVNLGFI